jgi:hypothetical protein
MANLPTFKHIHCSSRYDRSAASLDADISVWQQSADLITMTEVSDDNRAAQMRASGWAYYATPGGNSGADSGLCWEIATWNVVSKKSLKMSGLYDRLNGRTVAIWSATVVLRHVKSGHKLLVSVSHMPAHVEGTNGFNSDLEGWAARKRAFMTALGIWSTHVKDQVNSQKLDAVLVVADWNVNLKAQWFRQILHDHWGSDYQSAWMHMPTSGGVVPGGAGAPAGSPGQGHHDRIIDGSLYDGLEITAGPNLMSRVQSSDHRPFNESFKFAEKAGTPAKTKASDNAKGKKKKPREVGQAASVFVNGYGNVFHGEEWWGFGDTMDDELYFLPLDEGGWGEAGGEVL